MTLRTWEYDDLPEDLDNFLNVVDVYHRRFPKFKATVFAVPAWMEARGARTYAEIEKRDFLRLGVHGFCHAKREGRFKEQWGKQLDLLDRVTDDPRWSKIFKAAWYGYSEGLVQELMNRDYIVCNKALYGFPMPMPADLMAWNISSVLAAHYSEVLYRREHPEEEEDPEQEITRDDGLHVVAHPVYPPDSLAKRKAGQTEISERHIKAWTSSWSPDDEWAFVDDLTTPALLKIVLGCGDVQVWNDWACLDPRDQLDPRIIKWDFTKLIPFAENKADIVLTSHVMNYVPEDKYIEAALDIWRVLRPNGIWRMQEDCTDSNYTWRKIGQTNTCGQGKILSEPTKAKLFAALSAVGFEVHESNPGETLSPHKDVLLGDTRGPRWENGHKFYAEGVKRVLPTFDISRPRWHDIRAAKQGRYRLPDLVAMHAEETSRETH